MINKGFYAVGSQLKLKAYPSVRVFVITPVLAHCYDIPYLTMMWHPKLAYLSPCAPTIWRITHDKDDTLVFILYYQLTGN